MKNYSPLVWGLGGAISIVVIFYLVQAWGMQSWVGPLYQFQYKWYFIVPLIVGFGIQAGLFRAIHLKAKRGGGGTMAASGGVSTLAMAGCCLHNFAALLPILGISGLAIFVSTYQSYIFLVSIVFVTGGVIYMVRKYLKMDSCCGLPNNEI